MIVQLLLKMRGPRVTLEIHFLIYHVGMIAQLVKLVLTISTTFVSDLVCILKSNDHMITFDSIKWEKIHV